MKFILLITAISTLNFVKGKYVNCAKELTAQPPDPGSRCCGFPVNDDRIIGGQPLWLDEYPWLVIIEYDTANGTKLLCGGALISSKYVLTAAHCVTEPITKFLTPKSVRLGEYDISNDDIDCLQEEGVLYCADPVMNIPIERIIPHADYDTKSRRNDIALIRLKDPAPYTEFIQPVCLPTIDFTQDGQNGYYEMDVAGWGAINKYMLKSDVKQRVTLPYISYQDCQPAYNVSKRQIALWEKQFCAGGVKDKDSCKGDSGGPVIRKTLYKDKERTVLFELVGVISFGSFPCGVEHVPGVYTKVFAYKDWIYNSIKD